MERSAKPVRAIRAPDDSGPPARGDPDTAAVRDALEVLTRSTIDEADADEARARYRTQAMPRLEADARIAPLLDPDEHVVAVRRLVAFDRRRPEGRSSKALGGLAGDLYLTTRRLVLVGRLMLSFPLADIDQVVLSGERLLLVMHDGTGLALGVARPRLLRVEIAAARAYARERPVGSD